MTLSTKISINNVTKRYGETTIISDLSLDVKDGEFFTLLGPSGCGKTTLLRMISGFNSIEAGEISFNEKCINDIPAHKRNIGMVFQNYAIFPHLTVRKNVEYGLKQRKIPQNEINARVDEIMEAMHIKEYADSIPQNLSGGQQQRIALARAIVIKPAILLMDEPLSNLDAKLRIEMRNFIRQIQKTFQITTIYVTHDQEEALAISDRIGVMNLGVLQHVGYPQDIYLRPKNTFVSTFIGHSNLFLASLKKNKLHFNGGFILESPALKTSEDQDVIVGIRPEDFVITDKGIPINIDSITFLGNTIQYEFTTLNSVTDPAHTTCFFSEETSLDKTFYKAGDTLYISPKVNKINVYSLDKSLIS